MHADPTRPVFKGKTLLYLEESLSHWISAGSGKREAGSGIPYLLPTPTSTVRPEDLIAGVDALVLQGGVDLSPTSYGEEPLRPEWTGDRVRDEYETALIRAAIELDRPVLGICRGLQMINVALGGSLYQDITTQHPDAPVHRDYERYDRLQHDVCFEPGSLLARRYPGRRDGRVNTVHHQGVKELAKDLRVEARSVPDGVIEAVRYEPERAGRDAPFVYGVQWHPEYQDPADESLLATAPLRDLFLEAAVAKRGKRKA
ncbi:MAG TPA: gamma-glutamyl-gamma-aminobutyrate hydrolase family protein [Gemmatimonadales bacterium]